MTGRIIVAVVGVIITILLITMCSGPVSPQEEARRSAARVIDECKRQMNDTLNSASTREAHRFMCNGLRNDYVKTYGREP